MREVEYDRRLALMYAHRWAFGRNPEYGQFDPYGGDCTNYASQVLFAGCGEMNFAPGGWHYRSMRARAPAWSGVEPLYQFLVSNRGIGPYAAVAPLEEAVPGDLVQLKFSEGDRFRHSPVVVAVFAPSDPDAILMAAHTDDSDWRPLSSYSYAEYRLLHILGARVT